MAKLTALEILGSISVITKEDLHINKCLYTLKRIDFITKEIILSPKNPEGYILKKDKWYLIIQHDSTYEFINMPETFEIPEGLSPCAIPDL